MLSTRQGGKDTIVWAFPRSPAPAQRTHCVSLIPAPARGTARGCPGYPASPEGAKGRKGQANHVTPAFQLSRSSGTVEGPGKRAKGQVLGRGPHRLRRCLHLALVSPGNWLQLSRPVISLNPPRQPRPHPCPRHLQKSPCPLDPSLSSPLVPPPGCLSFSPPPVAGSPVWLAAAY